MADRLLHFRLERFCITPPVFLGSICHNVSEKVQDPQMPFKSWKEIRYPAVEGD